MSLTEKQLADRLKYVTGSDAAVILGLSPWKGIVQLYQEKTGYIEQEDMSDKPWIKAGNYLEPVIRQWFQDETGKRAITGEQASYVIQEYPDYKDIFNKKRLVGLLILTYCLNISGWFFFSSFASTVSLPALSAFHVHSGRPSMPQRDSYSDMKTFSFSSFAFISSSIFFRWVFNDASSSAAICVSASASLGVVFVSIP